MDSAACIQYRRELPIFAEEKRDGGLRTSLVVSGPCVRSTNDEWPEDWSQTYRVGTLVLVPKPEGKGYIRFSFENYYAIHGRSALGKKAEVMNKTDPMFTRPMFALATVDGVRGKAQRVLERYDCREHPCSPHDMDMAEAYRRPDNPLHQGWMPNTGFGISQEVQQRVAKLAKELPLFNEVKAKLFAQARFEGHLSTQIFKGGAEQNPNSKGSARYGDVSASWVKYNVPGSTVALVATEHCLGGYSNIACTDEIISDPDGKQIRATLSEQDSGIDWSMIYEERFKDGEMSLEQHALVLATWSQDIQARCNAVMIGLFGEDMAIQNQTADSIRIESNDEGGWGLK